MTAKKPPEIRKEEIFDAALAAFNKKGYYETSIDDIAKTAGISKGGIYHHFDSKKGLFIGLFHARVNRYFNALKEQIQDTADASDRLNDLVEKSEQIFQQNIEMLKFCLEFIVISARDDEIRKEVTAFYNNRVDIFTRIVNDGMAAGAFKAVDARSAARTLYFLSMGFFLTCFTADIDFDKTVQHALNMKTFFEGIKRQGT